MAFFSTREILSLERLLRFAKISRSTLYRHHKNLSEIAPDYEKYILKKCQNTMRRLMIIKKSRLRTLYQRILIFLSANQLIMKFLLEYGEPDLVERIVTAIKPKILATGKVKDGEMFTLYAKEISGLIESWCRSGFEKEDLIPTLDKIMYLTETAFTRLSPLNTFNRKPTIQPSTKQ